MKAESVVYKNCPVAYTDSKKGRNVVVFLHGFLGSKESWRFIVNDFPKRYRVVTVDLLGHGNTGCLGYVHSMEMMAGAVMGVIKHLKIRKFFIVGHSMGGYVSLALAEKFPDAILGLCLLNTSSRADTALKKQERLRTVNVVKENSSLFIRQVVPRLFHTKDKPCKREISRAIKVALEMDERGMIAGLLGMKDRIDREILLRFATYKVWFVVGEFDQLFALEDIQQQARLLQNGKCVLLKESGHMSYEEHREKTREIIFQFLKA